MPSARRGKLKPSELRAAFQNDLAAAWKRARALHPDHAPYAFMLYGVEGTPRLMPAVLTEESLTQIAQRELDITSCYDTLAEARQDFRYCVPDSPLFSELLHMLPSVNALMAPFEESLDDIEGYELLAKAAMDAFKALDKEGLFGTGPRREQLLLAIITQDVEKDWSLPSAKRLNPPATYRRFETDTRVTLRTISIPGHQCVSAVISPDGSRVAFEAHELGKYRSFISVCETATGHELARRKSRHLKALTFLPDNRTLAIAANDRTPSEPVCLWAVPDL